MTECNGLPLSFSRQKRRNIQADFNGGQLTSDAGAVLLREVDKHLGLIDSIAAVIPDRRDPSKITHDLRTLLAQRIFGIAMGYEDCNDHNDLRNDPLMQLVTERGIDNDQPLGSPATLCRMENSIDRQTLVKMSKVLVEQFIQSHDSPPDEIILDFDATDDLIHGQQEGRFFHGYYDSYCYLPLYVFCGEQLLCAYLRPSKIDGAKHSRALLSLLVKRFRQVWPNVKITFRGDSGFCRRRMLRWCDRYNVKYIIGFAKNSRVKKLARREITTARWRHRCTGQKQRIFGEVQYAAGSWDRQRRVIVKAEHTGRGENPRFVVTNIHGDPQTLYEKVYCQRGEMENRIKEQQRGLFADRTSCSKFLANQFRLLLSSAAYVLLERLRALGLKGTQLAKAQAGTIRLKLLKIGARVSVSVRRVVFHLASGYPLKKLFVGLLQNIRQAALQNPRQTAFAST